MTRERIVSSRRDGSVIISCPMEHAIQCLMRGAGWWESPWHGRSPWFWIVQFQRMVFRGVLPSAAYRYSRTMISGGVSRRAAIEIIAARDCGHLGEAIEIVDIDEIPKDRSYREAWRRSSNGGPIYIDETIACQIDEQRMWATYETA